ncbi:hypothetical protein ICE98_00541 [Lactococcus lactis]|nr:hypothetical protein [Lactococcus lactis]
MINNMRLLPFFKSKAYIEGVRRESMLSMGFIDEFLHEQNFRLKVVVELS